MKLLQTHSYAEEGRFPMVKSVADMKFDLRFRNR